MTIMAWQPEQEPLAQLSRCLRDSLSGHNKALQKQAELVGDLLFDTDESCSDYV